METFISVLIPATRKETLMGAILCVREAAITFQVEIIIKLGIDDIELFDVTNDIKLEFPELDIHIIKFNGRTSAHQNRKDALEIARGTHIHFLDDDDYINLDFYLESLRILSSGNDVALSRADKIIGLQSRKLNTLMAESINPSSILFTKNAAELIFEHLPDNLTCIAEDIVYLIVGNRILGLKYRFTNATITRGLYHRNYRRKLPNQIEEETYKVWQKLLALSPCYTGNKTVDHLLSLQQNKFTVLGMQLKPKGNNDD